MRTQELRIGNLVIFSDTQTLFEVIEIDMLGIRVKNKDEETWVEHEYFEPIPLTEEWLEKFGFTKQKASGWHGAVSGYHPSAFYFISEGLDEFKQYKHRHNFVFTNVSERRFEPCYQYNGIRDKGLELKYVHQLQNLYFALTREELSIKLD